MLSSDTLKNIVAVLALVTAAVFALNRLVLPQLAWRASFTDGDRHYESLGFDGLRYAVWDEPQAVAGDVNTDGFETRPTLSPDGRWMVFQAGEEGLNADLYVAEMVRGMPVDPRPLARANSAADEIAPAFGPGTLYFASNRGGGAGGFDLYFADWRDGEVGDVRFVESGINSPADECDPAPNASPSGDYDLCFASNRGEKGDYDLYAARWSTELVAGQDGYEVVPLAELNSGADEREPAWTSDGETLFFASDRGELYGSFDLYRARLDGAAWLEPAPLTSLNTEASERAPSPSADGFSLYYAAEPNEARFGRQGDLLRARSVELFRLPPRAPTWIDYLLLAALIALALLAWLAKRWETLDILYKCLLLSILLHLLLLWYFRNVHPEREEYPLGPGREATFHVRMLASGSTNERLRAREGALEVAPSAVELAPEPERNPAELAREVPPSEVAAREFERPIRRDVAPRSELGEAPARAASEPARTARLEPDEAPALESPREALERSAQAAPALVVVARAQTSERAQPSAAAPPLRDVPMLDRGLRELVNAEPEGASALERRADAAADVEAPAPAAAAHAVQPSQQVSEQALARTPSLEEPEESGFERLSGELRELSVASAAAFAPEARVSEGPSRADSREAPLEPRAFAAPATEFTRTEPATPSSASHFAPLPLELLEPTASAASSAPEPYLRAPQEAPAPLARAEPERKDPGILSPSPFSREATAMAEDPAREPRRFGAEGLRVQSVGESRFQPLALRAPEVSEEPVDVAPARLDKTPYRSRFGVEKEVALEAYGGDEETERAVALGLAYLSDHQRGEGHWGEPDDYHEKYRHVLVGDTGLALLAFLGAGHTQDSGTEYSSNVQRALDFLIAVQRDDNGHFGNSSSYSHGIATYALAECYALTQDPDLRRPIERGVAQILRHQYDEGGSRRAGGWSYYYADDSIFDRWPRVSITSWQVMALESARLGGIDVPDEAFDAAREFLLGAWDAGAGAFRYCHDPERLNSEYPILPASTPAALFALALLGEDVASEDYAQARSFIMRRVPRGYRFTSSDDFVYRARGNLYFWYYSSLALLRVGGNTWERWNAAMKETLLDSQRRDGSWEPIDVYSEYAGDENDDAIYSTAINVLTLEVYYRYFTPLLRVR